MNHPNGGFPPIKYCHEKVKSKESSSTIQRERSYAPKSNNINIRQILKKNDKPIIPIKTTKTEKIDILEDF
jgi:hypothetical protein